MLRKSSVTPFPSFESPRQMQVVRERPLENRFYSGAAALLLLAFLLTSLAFVRTGARIIVTQGPNQLRTGTSISVPAEISIEPVLPEHLTGHSREAIIKTRQDMVSLYPALARTYQPSTPVFEGIESNRPWFGTVGYFFYGVGPGAGVGPAAASRLILNPYALVYPEFDGLSIWNKGNLDWDYEKISVEHASRMLFPLFPKLQFINWRAGDSRASATFRLSTYLDITKPYLRRPLSLRDVHFSLHTLNAFDWGYHYLAASLGESRGVIGQFDSISPSAQRLEVSARCGIDGGCNHVSNPSRGLSNFKIGNLPARLSMKLWRTKPRTASQTPDFVFDLELL